MSASPEDVARSKAELAASRNRAARDAEVLGLADSVISDSRAARIDNGWADMVRGLFRGK